MSHICCNKETLAMASVPMQEWCEPYEWSTALKNGTIFPCLNLEFYKAEHSGNLSATAPKSSTMDSKTNAGQNAALYEISAIGFAINDLTLYLDTHPDCPKGLSLLKELLSKRLALLADYAAKYQPLTQLSIITGTPEATEYGWAEGPLPWEGGNI